MNRIYQGRATQLELLNTLSKDVIVTKSFDSAALKRQDHPLWDHHVIFQDAVNYYLVALASLARNVAARGEEQSDTERLAADLRKRVEDSWETFRGDTNRRSLKKSLSGWLELKDNATLDDAFDRILEGNSVDAEILALALQLILNKCGGDSAIQQGGREYLPKLSVAKTEAGKPYSGSFDFDAVAIASEKGKQRLAESLHGDPEEGDLRTLAGEMEITWAGIKCKPDEFISGDELKERLRDGVSHQKKRFQDASTRAEIECLELHPDLLEELERIEEKIADLAEDISLRVNKGGNISWDLVHAAYLFKLYPSKITGAILGLSIKKPKPIKSDSESPRIDFAKFGDDPLKLARGARGFVFRAFTALSCWSPSSPGQPTWKEFDIAAFKEALKSLNQFNQKTTERNENKRYLQGKIALLLGGSKPKGWKPRRTEDNELESAPEALDADLLKTTWELESRLTQELADTVLRDEDATIHFGEKAAYPNRDGQWRISPASLRGFRDIAEKWNSLADENGDLLSQADLETVVKAYQQSEKNKKQVGSVPLLLALCHPDYWSLWQKENDPSPVDLPTYNRFLFHVVSLHNDVRDFLRSQEPINLTPAEPSASRRLYMFSDITGKEKVVYRGEDQIETTVALREGKTCRKQRVRIRFSAPRLHRDQILGQESSRWLQPMTAALGFDVPEQEGLSAVSLMPDFDREGNARFLLNFPKTIDETWLKGAIGKESVWSRQFNGIKDKHIHLHWPDTLKKDQHPAAWWNRKEFRENGFSILSIDLGQRAAGAFARIHVTSKQPDSSEKRPWHSIGKAGDLEWYAIVGTGGMLRLPGEDLKVRRPEFPTEKAKGTGGSRLAVELSGSKGRKGSRDEYQKAIELARKLKAEDFDSDGEPDAAAKAWIGKDENEKSVPEQNDSLIALANRRLSRLNTFHRWSCFEEALSDASKDSRTKTRMVAALFAELSHWSDESVQSWHQQLRSTHSYLAELFPTSGREDTNGGRTRMSDSKKVASTWTDQQRELWETRFDPSHFSTFSAAASSAYSQLRKELLESLLLLAERTVPVRGKKWVWKTRTDTKEGEVAYGYLDWEECKDGESRKVRGQRGLSMARLEQLESLRTLFLRFNRALDKIPGKRSKVGFGFSNEAGEPAELLLRKIDRMKEQRVNQTAHLILAQALGVRLREHEIPVNQRRDRDVHGEYEKMEKYEPVEFVVIENLDRYLTSQGRAPSENRRLMKWAHRAVRDKLKMLCEEPFGIPVVEAPAAYSSRFSARTGEPGSRCRESSLLEPFLREKLEKRANGSDKEPVRDHYRELARQFELLAQFNDKTKEKGKPLTLLIPQPGGPLFLSAVSGKPWQADLNAAANIGLRALASPSAFHLLHKIRMERKKGELQPVLKNVRENNSLKGALLTVEGKPSKKLQQATQPNFFHIPESASDSYSYDVARLETGDAKHCLISGIALHTTTDELVLKRLVEINWERLREKGIET